MSVEDNNIEDEFKKILQHENAPVEEPMTVPPLIATLLCYCIPTLLIMSTLDYRQQNIMIAVILGVIIGTGFLVMYRHSAIEKAFYGEEKPSQQVIKDVQAQGMLDKRAAVASSAPQLALNAEGEPDWDNLITKLEDSLNNTDTLNVSTMFDRPLRKSAGTHPSHLESWLQRLFRRK